MIQANDLSPTLRRETVLTPLKLPESEQEQSIELDYVLPDYYPDFFRLLACRSIRHGRAARRGHCRVYAACPAACALLRRTDRSGAGTHAAA